MNNLDEDIKTIKRLISSIEEYGYSYDVDGEKHDSVNYDEVQAIKNVLSELAKYKQYYEEQNEVNKKFVSKDKFDEVTSELETYKKIAEKLADILSDKILETLGIKPRIEDLIESARKEVENG